jgi:hypothetical protein
METMQFGQILAEAITVKAIVVAVFRHLFIDDKEVGHSLVIRDRQHATIADHGLPPFGVCANGKCPTDAGHVGTFVDGVVLFADMAALLAFQEVRPCH